LRPLLTSNPLTYSYTLSLHDALPISNGLNFIQAAREANNLGANDALLLTTSNKISETTIANIFWVKGNTVFTPSKICDLLPGIRSEEHTSELQSRENLVCGLLLENKK